MVVRFREPWPGKQPLLLGTSAVPQGGLSRYDYRSDKQGGEIVRVGLWILFSRLGSSKCALYGRRWFFLRLLLVSLKHPATKSGGCFCATNMKRQAHRSAAHCTLFSSFPLIHIWRVRRRFDITLFLQSMCLARRILSHAIRWLKLRRGCARLSCVTIRSRRCKTWKRHPRLLCTISEFQAVTSR